MTSRFWTISSTFSLMMLAACGETPPPRAIAPPPPSPVQSGLNRVMGQTAPALLALFGNADLDVREGTGRKLQFSSAVCVLDAYLYPSAAGSVPTVRYIDARLPGGDDFDRASCIAALSRRAVAP
jgi:hypothetical protein